LLLIGDSVPYKYTELAPNESAYISLPVSFQGRVTRGVNAYNLDGQPQMLATWLEVSFDANGWIWGDVSLIRGCDGGVILGSTDGSNAWKGFNTVSSFRVIDPSPTSALRIEESSALSCSR
jgi:hypothetical protein